MGRHEILLSVLMRLSGSLHGARGAMSAGGQLVSERPHDPSRVASETRRSRPSLISTTLGALSPAGVAEGRRWSTSDRKNGTATVSTC